MAKDKIQIDYSINSKSEINGKRKRDSCDNNNINNRENKRLKVKNKDKIKLFSKDKQIYTIGNVIHFTASINQHTIEKIIRKITKIINLNDSKYKDTDEKLEIAYIVDSGGGCVTSTLKFIDFINLSRQKHPYLVFTSIITGLVASAGTIMCICADNRYMTEHAFAMVHELSAGNYGNYQRLISHSKFITNLHETLLDIYLKNTKLSKKKLEVYLAQETWFSSKEYLKAGFVTKII